MRRQLIGLAGVSLLGLTAADCCGTGEPTLVASVADDDCMFLGCAVAVDSEVTLYALTYGTAEREIVDASIDVSGFVGLAVATDRVQLFARKLGAGTVTVTLSDQSILTTNVRTEYVAATSVAVDPRVESLRQEWPGGRMQMFVGSRLRVIARHVDAAGNALLGHGLEQWTASSGMLVDSMPDKFVDWDGYEIDQNLRDMALVRDAIGTTVGRMAVRATRTGPAAEIDVVPPGSTAQLHIAHGAYTAPDTIVIGNPTVFIVTALSADGRYIHGQPAGGELAASTADSALATVEVIEGERALRVTGLARGTTEVIVTFDGVTARVPVTIR